MLCTMQQWTVSKIIVQFAFARKWNTVTTTTTWQAKKQTEKTLNALILSLKKNATPGSYAQTSKQCPSII